MHSVTSRKQKKGDCFAMKTEKTAWAVEGGSADVRLSHGDGGNLTIGDRISGFGGLVVDVDEDSVVVARRNAQGRYMELVFVGEAIGALRRA